jgi:hypothetical protein
MASARPAGAQTSRGASTESSRAAGAPSSRAVHFEGGPCAAVSPHDVAAALRVELAGRWVERAAGPDDDEATLDCAGGSVAISVATAGTPARKRQMNLASMQADIRARVVALALAELVRDLDRDVATPPPAPPSPPPPSIAPTATTERAPRDSSLPRARDPNAEPAATLAAFAQASTFGSDGTWLVGGGMRFDYAGRWWCAGLDAAALTMTERFAPGNAETVLAYAGPYAAWRQSWEGAQLRAGGGVALGAARLTGHASETGAFSGTTTGLWSAPYGFAALRVRVMGPIALEARGQLGWVTSPVIGEVSSGGEVALKGLWASVGVGVALAL